MLRPLFNLAALAAFFMSASPALAQQLLVDREWFEAGCAPRDSVIEHLKERYGERVISRGFIDESQLLEVFATPDADTWTVVIVRVDGSACVLVSGKNLENVTPKLLKPMGLPI